MKITRSRLKQIIKEELSNALTEEGESIGKLMKNLGYEKSRKAVESAIDFDEDKVDNMEDLKALIAKLRVEKDPIHGLGREAELDDIEKALRTASRKRSIRAIIKPIGRMTRYILKTLNYDEDRDVDYGIPGKGPGFVDDEKWAELKDLVKTTLSKIPKAGRKDLMYKEIMANIQKPRLHRTEIADFASAFDEYFIGLEAMVDDGDLK
jgi:hypothetical protein